MSFKIDAALIQEFIDNNFSLPMAHENLPYEPVSGTAYADLRVIPNDITVLSYNNSDDTDGVFRILLNYPADTGAVAAKLKADEIMTAFKNGTRLNYNGQQVFITKVSRNTGEVLDGWYRLPVFIYYYAIIAR